MKQSLKKAASVLKRGRIRAFVSRVAWLDLERLVSSAFSEISENAEETDQLGNLYLTNSRDREPFNKPDFYASNVTNQIQVQAGWRQLNVYHAVKVDEKLRAEPLAENGATLWFSQDASGSVVVFVAPYKSKAMTMNEDNIILARYTCATGVSSRNVRQHFSTYFRYCSVTSVHGDLGIAGYLFRLRLKYGDFRYSSQTRAAILSFLNKLLAAVGIIASLYTVYKSSR